VSAKSPFEAIVTAHGPVVLRVCRAVLGWADADDAWSETFLAALRAYPELPGDANVEAWLVRIAHNKAIDLTRAAARRAVPVADLPEPPTAAGAGQPSPTTTWLACPTPKWRRSSAAAPRPPGNRHPTASPGCAAPTRLPTRTENPHDRPL